MTIEQLEKIFESQIKNEIDTVEKEIYDYLIKKTREINFGHGFNMQEVMSCIRKNCFSDEAIKNFYMVRKKQKLDEITMRLKDLEILLVDKGD